MFFIKDALDKKIQFCLIFRQMLVLQTLKVYIQSQRKMNFVIDFTQSQQFQVSELQSMQDINEMTFIVPIFLFFQNNFRLLYNYASFLSEHPLIRTIVQPIATEEEIKQLEQYNTVLVRGTFDHLHLGHQVILLKAIYSTSQKLIIEVKDDQILVNKRLKQLLQPVDVRKENVRKFVDGLKPQIDIKIQVITEVYGSAPFTKAIDAVVITQESLHSLNHINKLRRSNGLKKVQMIISPLLAPIVDTSAAATAKQQRIDSKLSSYQIRKFLLRQNNFTLSEYLDYRGIWDSLVNQINSLCRVKDVDFLVAEKWWDRVLYRHSTKYPLSKKIRRNNKQIYQEISTQNNLSTPNQHSLNQIATNLALLFEGIEEEEKNLNGVVRGFLDGLLKKKGKSRTCKKIRKMIMNDIKEFVQMRHVKKGESGKNSLQEQTKQTRTIDQTIVSAAPEAIIDNITLQNPLLENIDNHQLPLKDEIAVGNNDTQQLL